MVYHYGRWVLDPEFGWVWILGNEWARAWVSWRRSHDHIGWAPLPPDRLIVRYRNDPDVWIFVQGRGTTAPLIVNVVVSLDRLWIKSLSLTAQSRSGAVLLSQSIPPSRRRLYLQWWVSRYARKRCGHACWRGPPASATQSRCRRAS